MSEKDSRSEPLITIITVVYNDAGNLEETIQSVKKLNYLNLEYVLIDGGSNDGTLDIIEKNKDILSYWISEKDSGIYHAMNKGWAIAKENSYILFLGAGDRIISLPDNMIKYKFNDVIYGNVLIGDKMVFKSKAGFHLKIYNSLHHQALLINKALSPAVPFNLAYPIYADFDFNQRLLKKGVNFVYSKSFMSFALPGGISHKLDFKESLTIIRKNYGLFWSSVAKACYLGTKAFPVLKRLRPFSEIKS